jgi:vacuolar-type H+-ATPase subunit H
MKLVVTTLTAVLALGSILHAEDNLADQLKRALDKAKVKIGEAAEKAGDKGREWYRKAKENLKLSRPEYLKRADQKLKDSEAQIAVLREMSNAPGQRDYFKTRVVALEQHLVFAKTEFLNLESAEGEAMFRARQSIFNKTVWTLEAAIEQAQEEAGL